MMTKILLEWKDSSQDDIEKNDNSEEDDEAVDIFQFVKTLINNSEKAYYEALVIRNRISYLQNSEPSHRSQSFCLEPQYFGLNLFCLLQLWNPRNSS